MRLVRDENTEGCRLFLYGPGTEVVTHAFTGVTECMQRQAKIEQTLLAAGYQLVQPSSDRRRDHGISQGPDHRRLAS